MAIGDKSALPLAVCNKVPDENGNITLSVEDIAELEASLSNKANVRGYLTQAEFDAISSDDTYTASIGSNITGMPEPDYYNIFHMPLKDTPGYGTQLISNVNHPGELYLRQSATNGVWALPIPIATATPPTWYDAPLEAGWARTADVKYGKDGAGKGYLVGVVNKASAPLSAENILCIPVGYRPQIQWPVSFTASCASGGGAWTTYGYLRTDGYLRFTGGALPSGYPLNQGIAFVAEFPVA